MALPKNINNDWAALTIANAIDFEEGKKRDKLNDKDKKMKQRQKVRALILLPRPTTLSTKCRLSLPDPPPPPQFDKQKAELDERRRKEREEEISERARNERKYQVRSGSILQRRAAKLRLPKFSLCSNVMILPIPFISRSSQEYVKQEEDRKAREAKQHSDLRAMYNQGPREAH